MLITSMRGKRWVIPKGIIEDGMTAAQSAANEAWEEAGIRGHLDPDPLGTFSYVKWGDNCTVQVFRMTVLELADDFPESNARRRCWLPIEEAAFKVKDAGLSRLILKLADPGKRRLPQ